MKNKILLLFSITVTTLLFGQNDIDKILQLQTRPSSRNGDYVQIIYNKLNNSSTYFQGFLQNKIGLTEEGDQEFDIDKGFGTIKTTYINKIIHGNEKMDYSAYNVFTKYKVFPIENDFFVETLDIWGNWESVAKIFILYYPTTINIENLKNNKTEITSYYLEDRAVFTSEQLNGRLIGRIKVSSTSNKTSKSFISDYDLKKKEFVLKNKEKERIQKEGLIAFLKERNTTTYSLKKMNNDQFEKITNDFVNMFENSIVASMPIDKNIQLVVSFDTSGIKTVKLRDDDIILFSDKTAKNISNVNIAPPKFDSYFVKTADTINLRLSIKESIVNATIKKSEVVFKKEIDESVKTASMNYLKKKDEGKYKLIVKETIVNDKTKFDITQKQFKKPIKYQKIIYPALLIILGSTYYLIN